MGISLALGSASGDLRALRHELNADGSGKYCFRRRGRVGTFTKADHHLIDILRQKIHQTLKVGCTGCGYCMPCPHGVDIPTAFRCYNQSASNKKFSAILEYAQITSLKKDSSAMTQCTKCGACEKHCPQHIEIRKELQNAKKALQPFYIRAFLKLVGKLVKREST